MSTMLDAKESFFKVQDGPAVSEQYTTLLDHGATGWTKRFRIGSAPPDRAPCPGRIGALEKINYAVFGCRKNCSELNWTGNSKSKMERKWVPIQILLFGCAWYLRLESKGSTQFQFLFGCTNHGIE